MDWCGQSNGGSIPVTLRYLVGHTSATTQRYGISSGPFNQGLILEYRVSHYPALLAHH